MAATFDKVIGLDADEMLGYFSLLTQFGNIANVIFAEKDSRAFIRSFAHKLWEFETIGKTRFFRPGISEFIRALARAKSTGAVKRVFILSNNPSKYMLDIVAEVINFFADPERKTADLISNTDVFDLNYPMRLPFGGSKSIHAIRKCLKMEDLRPEHIMFFDDIEQACSWQGCKFVLVKKYEYITPVYCITVTFFEEIIRTGIDIKALVRSGTYFMDSADLLANEIIKHWACSRAYMFREMALSGDDEFVPDVNHLHLKDTFVHESMLPELDRWLC